MGASSSGVSLQQFYHLNIAGEVLNKRGAAYLPHLQTKNQKPNIRV